MINRGLVWIAFECSATLGLMLMLFVARGWTHAADARVLAAIRPLRMLDANGKPTRLLTAARDIAALGGDAVRLVLLLGFVLALVAVDRDREAALLATVFVSARGALFLLKRVTRRQRPALYEHGVPTYTTSFPSGHTFMATVLFLSAALLVDDRAPEALQIAAAGFALGLSALIGWSRMVLAIHWPTDVIVGWLAGIAWACGWSVLAG